MRALVRTSSRPTTPTGPPTARSTRSRRCRCHARRVSANGRRTTCVATRSCGASNAVPPTAPTGKPVPRTEWSPSASLAARAFWFDGREATDAAREVPVETPVNVLYDSKPFAVMMTTPQDLEDFAYGFSFTEGVIEQASDIHRVVVQPVDRGIEVRVSFSPWATPQLGDRARNTAGRTGCGVCGIDQLDALPMAPVRKHRRAEVQLPSVRRALMAL